jgi:outer membrane protein
MKTFLRIFTWIILFTGIASIAPAQTVQKIGFVNFNELLQAMPGIDSVRTTLQKYQETLTDQLDQMRTEFENKYLDYQSKSAGMSDIIKQNKEQELTQLQERIDAFQQKAQTDLQTRQQQLLQPLIDKGKAAIAEVAKEHGYTQIINAIEDVVLYTTPSHDVMALVKKKLGME